MAKRSVPLDAARREHIGIVDRVVYRDADSGYTIIALTDGLTACGTADGESPFEAKTRWRFYGRWEEHAKYGYQFRWSTFVGDTPLTRAGITKYLTATCDGIGEKLASRIWDHYGPDSLARLRDEPERVIADGVLTDALAHATSQQLIDGATTERTKVELFDLLHGRGFHGRMIDRAISTWGAKAPSVIRRNPFSMLIKRLPSAGFKRCDQLYLDLGHRAESLKRQAILAWQICRTDSTGSTWLPAEIVGAHLRARVADGNPVRAIKAAIRARLLDRYRDGDNKLWLADRNRAVNERRVADALRRLSSADNQWPDRVASSVFEGDGLPSVHQAEQAMAAMSAPVGILCGGPGTGKTHTLKYILEEIIAAHGSDLICACAPTGNAAVRMTKSIRSAGLRAFTIHTTLQIRRNGHDGEGWGFQHNRGNPLPYRYVIVDETSMVDTDLMADLLDACAVGTHVLFIGDPHQLPPVGHGSPLDDMMRAGIPTGTLTEVRRNAGAIVQACAQIKEGRPFAVCDRYEPAAGKNLRLIETSSPEQSLAKLEGLLQAMSKFDPIRETLVLVATNKTGLLSRMSVNERLQKLLNPNGVRLASNPWAIDDKVICLKNTFLQQVERPQGVHPECPAEHYVLDARLGDGGLCYVANGEIGYVEAIGVSQAIVRFGAGDESKLVRVPMSKKKSDDDDEDEGSGSQFDFGLAYAITCHKSQGSESPCIIILIDEAGGRVCLREWHYTAMSRARDLCILIGRKETVEKQCRKVSLDKRKTHLKELIHASIPQRADEPG